MNEVAVVAAVLAGIAVGPFLRRLIDQVPGREPILGANRRLVPVTSWFDAEPAGTRVLVGSPDERHDTTDTVRRRWRAPAIDLGAAALLGVLAHRIGWSWPLPAYLVFGAALAVATVIDIDHYRIPDRIVFPALGLCLPLLALAALLDGLPGALIAAVSGAAAYFAFLFLFFVIWPRGMGFGDVKLALLLGLHLGWAGAVAVIDGETASRGIEWGLQLVLLGALIGSALGAVIGLGMLVVGGRRGAFPFGPALCLGAVLAIVFSSQLLN